MRIWIYEANLVPTKNDPTGIHDGDTIICDVDQGMNHWARKQYIRLAGINAPEISGASKPAGDLATQYLEGIINLEMQLYLATIEYHEFEKYGRVLAVVYTAPPTSFNWADATLQDLLPGSVNQEMIDSGHAVPFMQ